MKNRYIIGIDPGYEESGVVIYDTHTHTVENSEKMKNEDVLNLIKTHHRHSIQDADVVIEMIQSFGMPVGAEVFETVFWIGRFYELAKTETGEENVYRIKRNKIKVAMCGSSLAKDSNIRRSVIDLFPRTGGGKVPQIGIKKQKGPLYDVKKDCWQSLAAVITHLGRDNVQKEIQSIHPDQNFF